MGHMSIKPCTKESRCEVCWEDGCQQLPGCELNAGRKGMNTDLGPITVRLSEWHALQDANREAHDRIRELEAERDAAVLAEREACAVLLESKATEFERIGEPKLATPCRLMASAIRARRD